MLIATVNAGNQFVDTFTVIGVLMIFGIVFFAAVSIAGVIGTAYMRRDQRQRSR